MPGWPERQRADCQNSSPRLAGVEKDKDAVQAGLTWPINNGMVARPCHEVKTHQADDVWQSWLSPAPSTCAPCNVVFSLLSPVRPSAGRIYPLGKIICSFVTIRSRLCSRTGFNHLFTLNETGVTMSYHHCKLIASGVARLHGDLLLVQQSYPGDPHPYWGLPGGQVEPGEELLPVFQRELLEETGLTLVGTPTIAFVLQVLRKTQESIQEWLVYHFACEVAGRLKPQDPDGLILSGTLVEEPTSLEHF